MARTETLKQRINRTTGVNRNNVTNSSRANRRRAVRNIFRRKSTGGAGG